MPPRISSKLTTITDNIVNLESKQELAEALRKLTNALRGTYGEGEWNGGIGGTGFWCKYSSFWDAKITCAFSGDAVVSLPFFVPESIATIYHIAGTVVTVETQYLVNKNTIEVTASGTFIIVLSQVQSTKE